MTQPGIYEIEIKLNSIKDAMHNVHHMLGVQIEVVIVGRGPPPED